MNRRKYSNRYKGIKKIFFKQRLNYKKQINKLFYMLIILVLILILKKINNKLTSNVIQIINKGINYEFSIKEDGKKILDYSKGLLEFSGKTLEVLNIKKMRLNILPPL